MFTAAGKAASSSSAVYVEDVFSTWLYTGNGSSQTITNGIDLAGKGGLVWMKNRTTAGDHHVLTDTVTGATKQLASNLTDQQYTYPGFGLTSFGATGFTVTDNSGGSYYVNGSAKNYVGWTFREQAKFFDIVTYTGNGTARTITHNLGSVPGCIIVKSLGAATQGGTDGWWDVYHRGLSTPASGEVFLNSTDGRNTSGVWNFTSPTSTEFSVSSGNNTTNITGRQYVAYLFAHNAGGFGPAGTDNVISCGSFTTDGGSSFTAVNLGYEPQWLLIKASSGTSNWTIVDNMRGIPVGSNGARLIANLSDAETSTFSWANLTATGFSMPTGGTNPYSPSTTYIYIAIRRGPMKTPTTGTSVFTPLTYNGNGSSQTITGSTGVPDLGLGIGRTGGMGGQNTWYDRLRGKELGLISSSTNAQYNASPGGEGNMTTRMNGMVVENNYGRLNDGTTAYIMYFLSRAPGFFDVVCYTGTGAAQTQSHNLGVAPELLIVKSRDTAINWVVWASAPTPQQNQYALNLNTAGTWGSSGDDIWGATLTGAPNMTSTTFSLGSYVGVNGSAKTYVAYLFASVTGVSKVGSYTGTGALQTINCGFAAGARFVLIKRTDSTGDWWVYDSARGITSGNDPYLFLNSTAAEVTNTNYVDTASTGFQVTAAAPAGLNANGGTYIFLAIA